MRKAVREPNGTGNPLADVAGVRLIIPQVKELWAARVVFCSECVASRGLKHRNARRASRDFLFLDAACGAGAFGQPYFVDASHPPMKLGKWKIPYVMAALQAQPMARKAD